MTRAAARKKSGSWSTRTRSLYLHLRFHLYIYLHIRARPVCPTASAAAAAAAAATASSGAPSSFSLPLFSPVLPPAPRPPPARPRPVALQLSRPLSQRGRQRRRASCFTAADLRCLIFFGRVPSPLVIHISLDVQLPRSTHIADMPDRVCAGDGWGMGGQWGSV